MKKELAIIDTFGFLFRSYYALPPLKNRDGFPTGLLTGFINFIYNLGKDFSSDYYIFAIDSKARNFRKDICDNYKANRKETPSDLLIQLDLAIKLLNKMGFHTIKVDGYEADDIIASIVEDSLNYNINPIVVSHDKDLYQLLDSCRIFDPIKRVFIDKHDALKKYGVDASNFIDYQALVGDSADNIDGVKGVGAKTAQKLISQFQTIENIYNNIDKVESKRHQTLLINGKDRAFISKELVTLKRDIYKLDSFKDYEYPSENPILKIEQDLIDLEITPILDRVKNSGMYIRSVTPKNLEFQKILILDRDELSNIINNIPQNSVVSFDTETTSLDTSSAKIVGFSFAYDDKKSYYIPIAHSYLGVLEQIELKVAKDTIIDIFSRFRVVGQNIKYDLKIIRENFDLELKPYCDTMIMSWLIDPQNSHSLDKLAKEHFQYSMVAFKDIVPKNSNFAEVDILEACEYAAEDAYITLKLYNLFIEKMDSIDKNYQKILFDIEMPFIEVLMSMEDIGVLIDKEAINSFDNYLNSNIESIKSEIYKYSETKFNINSPKQLSHILFEELKLESSKKSKSGYSTDEKVLNKLKDTHPIIPLILEYRELFKLSSTYVKPFSLISTNRIHTSFLQTGTATGRLSSKNPNLQNIPTRTEIGSRVRECFISKDGYSLVSADYSQIELRLLAHFSNNQELVDAFNNDLDVHLATAKSIFKDEYQTKREIAKTINYGLIYGMGSRKLAQTLNITTSQAKEYIDRYFESFGSVKSFLDSIKKDAHKNGYVSSILGRRRVFDFANIRSQMLISSLERESVNTLFQSSAADLIKLAMNKIYMDTKDSSDIDLLLQIHDELIFEVKDEVVDEFCKYLKDAMENIYTLRVPIECNVNYGKKWSQLK